MKATKKTKVSQFPQNSIQPHLKESIPLKDKQVSIFFGLMAQVQTAQRALQDAQNNLQNYAVECVEAVGYSPMEYHVNWDTRKIEPRPKPKDPKSEESK